MEQLVLAALVRLGATVGLLERNYEFDVVVLIVLRWVHSPVLSYFSLKCVNPVSYSNPSVESY